MRSARRRVITKLLLFLLAGAIVNVSVAWIPLLRTAWAQNRQKRQPGLTNWPKGAPEGWPAILRANEAEFITMKVTRYVAIQNDPEPGSRSRNSSIFQFDVYDVGWPLRALRAKAWRKFGPIVKDGQRSVEYEGDQPHGSKWEFGIPAKTSIRRLPILPLWPGFAINTIFYAVIVWMLFAVPGAVRRRLRRKRGLCASCGYSLRGRGSASANDMCPECGAEA